MEVLQVATELKKMVALYRKTKPRRILEIGCWDGGTLQVWLEGAAPGATVVAVDLDHRNQHVYETWRKPDTVLHLITASSHDLRTIDTVRKLGPYDWAFVDGDHGPIAVRLDIVTAMSVVRPGGLMLLHDITPPAGQGYETYPPGDAMRELADLGYDVREFVDPHPEPWAHGIGVVQL